jgi:peptide/nickel transport system substrate-binding protein
MRPLERAAFVSAYSQKKLKNLIQGASGAFGNAATRLAAFAAKGGAYAYGSYSEIDELFARQEAEIDVAKRTELLHRAQQFIHERSVYAPIWQLAFLNGVGKRVGESGFGLIKGHAYSAPYEDVTIRK